jgi:hypothetical protein
MKSWFGRRPGKRVLVAFDEGYNMDAGSRLALQLSDWAGLGTSSY